MTVWMVTTYHKTALFASREVAEESIARAKAHYVDQGLVGNIGEELIEVVVHERPFDVYGVF